MARPKKERIAANLSSVALERRELWEHVAGAIRDAILSGAIPAGSNLVEADLADRFAVSRGPIRQALTELARDGLVVDLARRGTIVSTLSFADLREVYGVRDGLESVAVRQAVDWATDEELAGLVALDEEQERAWHGRDDYEAALAAHLAFNRGIVQLSGNRRLIAIYEQMLSQTQLLLRTSAITNPLLELAPRRSAHRSIVQALLARSSDRAQAAVVRHYAYGTQRLIIRLTIDSDSLGSVAIMEPQNGHTEDADS